MKKKCEKHANAVSLKWGEPMDTTFYERGTEAECCVCIQQKAEAEERANKIDAEIIKIIESHNGSNEKKEALIFFLRKYFELITHHS